MFAITLFAALGLSPAAPPETPEATIESMSARIAIDARDYDALLARGIAYRTKKDYARSTADFTAAAAIKSTAIEPLRERAITAIRNGKHADAQNDLQKALKIDPKLEELTKKYSRDPARKAMGDQIDRAIRMSLKAKGTIVYARVSPQDVAPSELAAANGELQSAVRIVDRAIDLILGQYADDVVALESLLEMRIVISRTD
jgi:tetratricopeptide (TPR) repeat protein